MYISLISRLSGSSFIARVEWCVNNNLPFVDQENNFLPALNTKETFAQYSTQVPLKEVKTVSELSCNTSFRNNGRNTVSLQSMV